MEIPGLCSMCGKEAKPAYTCSLCGAIVCSADFTVEKGLCRKCSVPTRIE